ncbi:MAG TPA: energy transducer TonB [Steroidobacteraceae bacterium]|jgi:hypothetical protein
MNHDTCTRAAAPQILLFFAVAASGTAYGDLLSAQAAYNKGAYQQALEEYRGLAELGEPTAQFDLAVMYARGLAVPQSELYAYAWASLAAENGDKNGRALEQKLQPDLAPGSRPGVEEIRNQFGRQALEERLLPKIQDDESAEAQERQSCRTTRLHTPQFPSSAFREGVQGGVYAEYTLLADGSARNPRVIYAQPQGVFDAAVRESLLHSRFAGSAGKPIQCTSYYDFVNAGGFDVAPRNLLAYVEKVHAQAQAGAAGSQLLYGLLIAGLPQLQRPRSEAMSWFLHAAQSGSAVAQYQVGYSLLTGWGCQRDEKKALQWLQLAADHDQPNAQVTLAEYSLRGTPDEAQVRQAKGWLERAAASGSRDGKVNLAVLLAAGPYADVRDPARARSLSEEAFAGVEDDPTGLEIRAAAAANAGNFDTATTEEQKALGQASGLAWNLAPLKDRLSHYRSHQAWNGNLL